MNDVRIRRAEGEELRLLREIEAAADHAYRSLGMDVIADSEPTPIATLRQYQQAGRALVDTAGTGSPVAFLLLEILDGSAHIEQVSVRPEYRGQGRGRDLINAAETWARGEQGLRSLTLTTYAHVPWNAPYYERLGFSVVPPSAWTSDIRTRRQHEAAMGLDAWPRVVMSRELRRGPGGPLVAGLTVGFSP